GELADVALADGGTRFAVFANLVREFLGRPRQVETREPGSRPKPGSTAGMSSSSEPGSGSRRNRQWHELEAVDVDEPAVGQLQAGDHREREEREMLERRVELAAKPARGLDHCARRGDDLLERRVGEQP